MGRATYKLHPTKNRKERKDEKRNWKLVLRQKLDVKFHRITFWIN